MRRHAVSRTLGSALLPLLLLGLTACGGQEEAAPAAGLEAVSVSGQVGTAPKVTWNSRVEVDALQSEVLVEGRGDELAADDQVISQVWIGNGYSQTQEFSTYEEGKPEVLTVGDPELLGAFAEALEGRRIGSRVLVLAPPADAFGEGGNPDLDIGNEDDVVFVVDLTAKVLTEPSGQAVTPPAKAPTVVETDGVPTGIDFSEAPRRPAKKLQTITLVRGDGAKVAKGDNLTVDYLGQVYRSKNIFDQSFDKEPFATTIGTGSVIKGWDQALVGQTVGSRVLLVIPPDLAYGEQGSGENIPPDATLTFVIDILAAY